MSLESFFESIAHKIANLFGSHEAAIQAVIADAQSAASALSGVAMALKEPSSVTDEIANFSKGLSLASAAVDAAATATTLTEQATNIANLTTSLVTSGAIDVKNRQTSTAIATAAQKAVAVVTALQTAATAATGSPAS